MLSSIISRSTAAFGGAPFRLNKCTALGSAGSGAAAGAAAGGVPGALVGLHSVRGCTEAENDGLCSVNLFYIKKKEVGYWFPISFFYSEFF